MLCLVKVMKYFFLVVVLSIVSLKSHSIQIMTECISESGSSTFKIVFETKNNSGFLDYEFMNQEVRYLATLEPVFEGKIFGSAEFLLTTELLLKILNIIVIKIKRASDRPYH